MQGVEISVRERIGLVADEEHADSSVTDTESNCGNTFRLELADESIPDVFPRDLVDHLGIVTHEHALPDTELIESEVESVGANRVARHPDWRHQIERFTLRVVEEHESKSCVDRHRHAADEFREDLIELGPGTDRSRHVVQL